MLAVQTLIFFIYHIYHSSCTLTHLRDLHMAQAKLLSVFTRATLRSGRVRMGMLCLVHHSANI